VAYIVSLNALAFAKVHLCDLDRLKKLLKMTVLLATTEQFAEHAPVADGASNLFFQIFGPEVVHVRWYMEYIACALARAFDCSHRIRNRADALIRRQIAQILLAIGLTPQYAALGRHVFHYPGDLLAKFILRAVDGLNSGGLGSLMQTTNLPKVGRGKVPLFCGTARPLSYFPAGS